MGKKSMTMLITVLLISMILSACGSESKTGTNESGQSGGKVTLRFSWWGGDSRHQATLAALDKYMELNPNVKIEAEYGGFDGYEQKLKTQLAGGTAPDLVQVDQPWLYDLTMQGDVFVDLNTMSDVIELSNFDEKFLNDYTVVNGQLQGLPSGMNGMILTYNKDFFEKYGIPEHTRFDWDNLLEIGKKVHDQSNGKDVLLNVDPGLVSEMFKAYVRQKTGNQIIQEDFTLGFDKALAVEALEYIKRYLDAGVIQPFEESSAYDNKVEQHAKWFKGEFGMIINFASTVPVVKKDIDFKVDVMPNIVAKEAKTTAIIARPSQLFSISRNSKHPEETAKLLNWLLNDGEAALILGDVRGTSASKTALKVLEDDGKLDPVVSKATQIALETGGGPENGITNNAELGKIRGDIIAKLAYKRVTPEQAAEEMITSLNAKLQELKRNQ